MKDLRSSLAKMIHQWVPGEGYHQTPVPGVYCTKISETDRRSKRHWHARFAIVAQGCKEIVLGPQVYRAEDTHYTVTPVDLPVISRVATASVDKPFLALLIDFDPQLVSEVASQFKKDEVTEAETSTTALFTGQATDAMLECALRLVKLFQAPEDAAVLGPLIIREIFYHLLKGVDGAGIRQFVLSGNKMHKISQAIYQLKAELSEEIDIEALAKATHMSRSAFFHHFKEATALSPIQYQKRLRLLEARRLMMEEGESAEGSAFRVGYKSASQFSREYSRMFGTAPLRDIAKIKKTRRSVEAI